MRHYFVFAALILSPIFSQAVTKFVSLSGASNYVYTESTKTLDIYGGIVSDCSADAKDDYTTCNSCEGQTTAVACNKTSIYPNLILKIGIKTDASSVIVANTRVIMANDKNEVPLALSTTTLSANESIYAEITWSDLCSDMGSSDCTGQIKKSFKLGFDKDNNSETETDEALNVNVYLQSVDTSLSAAPTPDEDATTGEKSCPGTTDGICDFELKEGDEKFYVRDFKSGSAYPNAPEAVVDFYKAVIFYEPNGTTVSSSSKSSEIKTTVNGESVTLSKSSVGGLTNDTEYSVVLANMDLAGNIFYFTDPQPVTPKLVTGILEKDKCFIATAAYGSLFDSKVQDLRKFRDQVLLKNRIGAEFVRWYYENSPAYADWIAERNYVRALVRGVLWPVWSIVYLFLNFPWALGALVVLAPVIILFVRRKKGTNALEV